MKDKTGWNKYRHKRKTAEPQETELVIESLTNSGDGLGRLDERVVFVPYTLPGDKVRIKLTQRKKTYALAEKIEILEPSTDRIAAECGFFEQCGGCDWQHVPYPMQLAAKEQQLRETLERIGKLATVPISPIAHVDSPYHYRNRIQGELRGGEFHYKKRRSDQRVAVSHCKIAEEPINQWLQSPTDQNLTGRVEIAVVDGQVVVAPINERNSTELGFRQVNSAVSELLTEKLLNLVAQNDASTVVDLYCGRGTWTNLIAARHPEKQVSGVDSSSDNIEAARADARQSGLKNVQFHHGAVEKLIPKISVQDSVCIVDPPRAGLDVTVTERLIQNRCKALIYVSCHPATLARDLSLLSASVYRIESLQPLDMFPQTAHLECLVYLTST